MPWVSRWEPKFKKSTDEALKGYREVLDGLTRDDVDWSPFVQRPGEKYDISLFHGVLQLRHLKEPYMPDWAMRQFGYMQTIPPSPYVPNVKELRWKPNAYVCEFHITPKIYQNSTHIASDLMERGMLSHRENVQMTTWNGFLERTHIHMINPHLEPKPITAQEL